MNLKLLIYNSGLDKLPEEITKHTRYTNEVFDRVTNELIVKSKPFFSCDPTYPFVRGYNETIADDVQRYARHARVDICIMQEICTANINQYEFKSYIGAYYYYPNAERH